MKKGESSLASKQLLKHVAGKKSPHSFYLLEFEQNVRNTAGSVYPEYPIRRQNEGRFFTYPY